MTEATDAAAQLAAEHAVDLDSIEGSGKGGAVTVADVKAAIDAAASGPPPGYEPVITRLPAAVAADQEDALASALSERVRVLVAGGMARADAKAQAQAERDRGEL